MPDFSDYTEEERSQARKQVKYLALVAEETDSWSALLRIAIEAHMCSSRREAELLRLREMLREANSIIDDCQSGYIPGCGEDELFDARKDEWLAGYKKAQEAL